MTNASTLKFETSSPALEALGYQITARISADGRSTRWSWVNHATGDRGVSYGSKDFAETFARANYDSLFQSEKQACKEFGQRAAAELAKTAPVIKAGSDITFSHYGETKTGKVARVANDIVHLTSGRWLHLQSCTLVNNPTH